MNPDLFIVKKHSRYHQNMKHIKLLISLDELNDFGCNITHKASTDECELSFSRSFEATGYLCV